jgi:hypothetical protein
MQFIKLSAGQREMCQSRAAFWQMTYSYRIYNMNSLVLTGKVVHLAIYIIVCAHHVAELRSSGRYNPRAPRN